MPAIDREPLRDLVREELVERVMAGELSPDERLNTADLASDLGVSRTPLREALVQLELEGIVRSEPSRGFFIEPLSLETADELYPLAWHLECLALKEANRYDEATLRELEEINRRRAEVIDQPSASIAADMDWHDRLVAGAGNRQLQEILRILRLRQYRYEYRYARGPEQVRKAIQDHQNIIAALRQDDRKRAGRLLEEHWQWGYRGVREALEDELTRQSG